MDGEVAHTGPPIFSTDCSHVHRYLAGVTEECELQNTTGTFVADCTDPASTQKTLGWVALKHPKTVLPKSHPDFEESSFASLYFDSAFFALMATLMVATEDGDYVANLLVRQPVCCRASSIARALF